eukprot:5815457-Pyramimonas_sp.AAC.1
MDVTCERFASVASVRKCRPVVSEAIASCRRGGRVRSLVGLKFLVWGAGGGFNSSSLSSSSSSSSSSSLFSSLR